MRRDAIMRLGRWLARTRRCADGLSRQLCLAPQDDGLAHAEVHLDHGRLRLVKSVWQPGAEDAAWMRIAQDDCPTTLILPFADYRLQVVDPPAVPPEEVRQAVRWIVASRHTDEPIETLTLDFIRLDPQRGAAAELLVVTARSDTLRQYVERAHRAGVSLTAIDIAELAQRNIAARLSDPEGYFALLALTPWGGLLTVTHDGELCFYRHIEFDWKALTGRDPLRCEGQLTRLALELQRSLDYLERHHNRWLIERVHMADTLDAALLERIGHSLNVPLTVVPTTRIVDSAEPLRGEALARMWFALGGALRSSPA